MRCACAGESTERATARSIAATIPHATASPCSIARYRVAASMACPTVWPRFSSIRWPDSRSSALTIAALIFTESSMACVRVFSSPLKSLSKLRSSHVKNRDISQDSSFHAFDHPGAKFPRRQSRQDCWVGKHRNRMMEAADQIFSDTKIHARFAADAKNRSAPDRWSAPGYNEYRACKSPPEIRSCRRLLRRRMRPAVHRVSLRRGQVAPQEIRRFAAVCGALRQERTVGRPHTVWQ